MEMLVPVVEVVIKQGVAVEVALLTYLGSSDSVNSQAILLSPAVFVWVMKRQAWLVHHKITRANPIRLTGVLLLVFLYYNNTKATIRYIRITLPMLPLQKINYLSILSFKRFSASTREAIIKLSSKLPNLVRQRLRTPLSILELSITSFIWSSALRSYQDKDPRLVRTASGISRVVGKVIMSVKAWKRDTSERLSRSRIQRLNRSN